MAVNWRPGREPFLTSAKVDDHLRSVPVGWVAYEVGSVGGVPYQVVFDPGRHDIMLDLAGRTSGLPRGVAKALVKSGWRRLAIMPAGQVWVRQRLDPLQAALQRLHATPRPSAPTRA